LQQAVQLGCHRSRQFRQADSKKENGASDHLREKNIASPAERSGNANAFLKLEAKDLRFSMKMTFAPYPGIWLQPV
jgi:hypothetical protein